jgi:hypothetical protein
MISWHSGFSLASNAGKLSTRSLMRHAPDYMKPRGRSSFRLPLRSPVRSSIDLAEDGIEGADHDDEVGDEIAGGDAFKRL